MNSQEQAGIAEIIKIEEGIEKALEYFLDILAKAVSPACDGHASGYKQ
ncbi:MAG: hypothetical protein IJH92_00630 [Mogibacterium sp.]|nr:hypothetical protein [Mogibacterium sp.]